MLYYTKRAEGTIIIIKDRVAAFKRRAYMSIKYILYNPLSGNGKGEELSKKLTDIYKD